MQERKVFGFDKLNHTVSNGKMGRKRNRDKVRLVSIRLGDVTHRPCDNKGLQSRVYPSVSGPASFEISREVIRIVIDFHAYGAVHIHTV